MVRLSRLHALVAAGLVDSFGLSLGWTVFTLYAAETQGLGAAGAYGAAMLIGVALSAPATSWIATRLNGRRLLRATVSSEIGLRVATFALLLGHAPVAALACAVALTNVVAWTGYAGMRAEVAALDRRAATMTSYVVAIASIEAIGVAAGALLPVSPGTSDALLAGVIALYGASLLPTLLVATGSRVPRARRSSTRKTSRTRMQPLAGGFLIMALASGPTLLSAALALKLHGRTSVVAAALAFTVGSLLAPKAAGVMTRKGFKPAVTWPALGIGMVVGWIVAPWHVAGLMLAQVLSGLSMSAFEGMMDVRVAADGDDREVTSALAWSAATRALGSALAVGLAPAAIAAVSLSAVSAGLAAALGVCLLGVAVFVGRLSSADDRLGKAGLRARPGSPVPAEPA